MSTQPSVQPIATYLGLPTALLSVALDAHKACILAYASVAAPPDTEGKGAVAGTIDQAITCMFVPTKTGFVLFFTLPGWATNAAADNASLAKAIQTALGPNYVVGIGTVYLSAEYRPKA